MQTDSLLATLPADGARLAAAAERAGWDAPVPATEWQVRDLVVHVGGVHRWATDIVRTGSSSGDTDAGRSVGAGPSDAELLDWFRDGVTALVETLHSAPPDLECFAFLPAESPRAFWVRRQAHETAVHRADVERAGGELVSFDANFAQDGIAEMLTGFARRRSNAISTPATILLRATDGDPWTIVLGGDRIEAEATMNDPADVTIVGSSGDLYQWLWNRPSPVRIDGDQSAAELWRSVQVRWS